MKDLIIDLFRAYYDARKNKRNTLNALEFEIDYEKKLFELVEEIKIGKYYPGQSVCFITNKPVKREIFAATFRDRIVHHLVFNYVNPIFERRFINDSYSCRIGKGTSYGIKRVNHFIRSCSENYHRDCYILKLDISGYFMSIDRKILYDKIEKTLNRENRLRKATAMNRERERERESKVPHFDLPAPLDLIRKIVFHDPAKNCRINGARNDWVGLPKSKSLFFARPDCGLPIGNLTSQLFGNVYLDDFDHFVKYWLGCKYYGRYVDDIIIIHRDKDFLKHIIPLIRDYLLEELKLKLHRNKIYLQYYSKGVKFLGVFLKPYRKYILNRTKGNFYAKIKKWNELLDRSGNKLSREQVFEITACANSYLGLMKHCSTKKLQRKIFDSFSVYFWNYFYIDNNILKIKKSKWKIKEF